MILPGPRSLVKTSPVNFALSCLEALPYDDGEVESKDENAGVAATDDDDNDDDGSGDVGNGYDDDDDDDDNDKHVEMQQIISGRSND